MNNRCSLTAVFCLLTIGFMLPERSVPPVMAQETQQPDLPPLFENTPKKLVPAKTIVEFPAGTFLENIALDKAGNLFITSLEDGKIWRVTPQGQKKELARLDAKVAGIAFDRAGNLIVGGWAGGKTPSVFRVTKGGKTETLTVLNGAMFPNGITHLTGDRFLIADSYKGAIWEFNARTKQYRVWLEDPALTRASEANPVPGVNGLKIYNNVLYATNTQRQQLLRIPLLNGGKPGKLQVILNKINGDDFALDNKGNLYITTHFYNNVVRVTPQGKMTVIAEVAQGLRGDTSVAFGRSKNDRQAVYVVTNGGVSLPPPTGPETARVVRLDVGQRGYAKE